MQLGDCSSAEHTRRTAVDAALDTLDDALTELITIVEAGGLDQLDTTDKVAVWQRFEIIRNRLPVVDHSLIADAEAADLPGTYCFNSMTQLLVRMFQLSPGEAASRVRAAAAVGPRSTMLGERLQPVLPKLAELQRDGAISPEKVAIVERAIHKLSRPDIDPAAVQTAKQLLTDHAPVLGPKDLHRFAVSVVEAADSDGPEPVDDQLQQDRRNMELKQRRYGMWWLQGKLTATVGAQLTAILDPLAKPRTTELDTAAGCRKIADERPYGQRMHDAFDEVCGRVLRMGDKPATGGAPASVIVTVDVDDLLAKAGLAETSDGSQLTSDQLMRIADEAEIWPTIINRDGIPLALGRTQRLASPRPNHGPDRSRRRVQFPGCTHPPSYCDRHHIVDWILGGPTDLDNLTLLCRYHHTHFLQRGWTCQINADGLPEWLPPWWIDSDQRRRVNSRIQRLNAQRQLKPRRR
ncbi:MAG TPA: DUF222 domain-containing protein [Propionibacteriaceae bacterium]